MKTTKKRIRELSKKELIRILSTYAHYEDDSGIIEDGSRDWKVARQKTITIQIWEDEEPKFNELKKLLGLDRR